MAGRYSATLHDVVDKAQIEHAVGLVQHQKLDPGKVDGAPFGMIEQPPRRRDHDIDAAVQPLDLRLDGHPAVDHRRAQRQAPGIIVHLLR